MALTSVVGGWSARADEPAIVVEGPAFSGRVVRIDDAGQVEFAVGAQTRRVAARDLVRWGKQNDAPRGSVILLDAGDILVAPEWTIQAGTLQVSALASPLGVDLALPLGAVRGICVDWPAAAGERDRVLESLRSRRAEFDECQLVTGDTLRGTLLDIVRRASDAGGEAGESEVLRLRGAERTLEVPLERVRTLALRTSPPARRREAPRMLCGLRDGTRLEVSKLTTQDSILSITLASGLQLTAESELFCSQLVFVQPLGYSALYLSDLEPLGYKHVPFLSQSWNYGRDRNAQGGRLRQGGQLHSKGLGMHSTSRLAYELAGRFRRFQAELSLDDAAGAAGSVVVRVLADRGDSDWQALYESPVLRGGQAPIPLDIDVKGVQRLALIVEEADHGDEQDHLDWLDARLLP